MTVHQGAAHASSSAFSMSTVMEHMAAMGQDVGYIIHQSDLAAWQRCPAEFAYSAANVREDQNSASAWGTVMHHALHVMERFRDLDRAIETFLYFWHPLNIDQVTEPVPQDGWLPRQDYNTLRQKGVEALRRYAELSNYDEHEVLALEYDFIVPVAGTPHYLAGTIDRLAVRWHRKLETLCIDDYKSGRQKWGLRYNVQGSAYAYASLCREFWTGHQATGLRPFRGAVTYTSKGFSEEPERAAELMQRFRLIEDNDPAPRLFTWINLKENKWVNGGYRSTIDYQRLQLAVTQIAASIHANIYPLNISGETCQFCNFRKHCGLSGLPDAEHGAPLRIGA